MRIFFLVVALTTVGCSLLAQEKTGVPTRAKAERKLFKRSSAVLKFPQEYLMRETGKGDYDPKPRVVTVDEKAGRYELRWIGYDGKEKIIKYLREDAFDASVEASVKRVGTANSYRYLIRNLPSSPNPVRKFIVQTFAEDIGRHRRVPGDDDLYVGHMSTRIPLFSSGVWRKFALLNERAKIHPGSSREFEMTSTAQPGVVKCYGGAAESTLKGVGEHMPSELEMAMPGFEELASCITIGPDERLAKFSEAEKIAYLQNNLAKFVEAGWMTDETAKIYKDILQRNDLAGVLKQAKTDLAYELITGETFYVIEGLKS